MSDLRTTTIKRVLTAVDVVILESAHRRQTAARRNTKWHTATTTGEIDRFLDVEDP